ncbi:MAG: pseudouridine synthase [Burkholderiaceae bacterium]|nr:pseudouridine synthase [Burkholderiaceae bacterium]
MSSRSTPAPSQAPLPMRDGVAPSYFWLPQGQWNNLLDCLCEQFPAVSEATWLARLEKREVLDAYGQALQANSVAKRGMCIFYYREIENESPIPFEEHILFQDAHLLVVDKPHFLPVIPGGRFLHECLLVRLRKKLGNADITPIHRLDRETAGVMLFSINAQSRGLYQVLFQQRKVDKLYHALAPELPARVFPLHHESRLEESERFFIMQEIAGIPNSSTVIDIIEKRAENNLYQLQPSTGKRHQLRVHMASLGAPIVNDTFYPLPHAWNTDDYTKPLQLLAKSIAFCDPISGALREFHSRKKL